MIVLSKACPICGEDYTPIKRGQHWTETCGTPTCRSTLGARREGWRAGQANAVAATKKKADERIAAKVEKQFGELSERELQLFRVARRIGYQDGSNAARSSARKAAA